MHEHLTDQQTDAAQGGLRRRLGRGLSALLGGGRELAEDEHPGDPAVDAAVDAADEHHAANVLPIDSIERNPFQPRKEFGEEALEELAASIRQHGLLQPLLVRAGTGGYQLIAGERRWLAAARAGLQHVPCRVLELDDQQVYEVAIEENIKRKDLGVLEKAEAFRDYLERFGCSIEELAGRLSMNRATVSNFLRLLDLSAPVKEALQAGRLSNGHARSLLSLDEADQIALCRRIVAESLSVRKTEEAVKQIQQLRQEPAASPSGGDVLPMASPVPTPPGPSSHVLGLQEQLRSILGVKVEIQVKGRDAGKIVIPFASNDEFEELLRRLRRSAA